MIMITLKVSRVTIQMAAKLTHPFHLRFDSIPFAPNKFIINLWIYFKSHGINRIWRKGVREEGNSLRESVAK